MSKTKKIRILLVEDDPIAQKVGKLNFETYDCEVDLAETGKEALSCIQDNCYTLILMDIGLTDTNGYDITKKVRELEKRSQHHATIIALSAHIDNKHKQQCIQAGMDAVYNKPLTPSITRSILNTYCTQ